jgi:hypothetical protein
VLAKKGKKKIDSETVGDNKKTKKKTGKVKAAKQMSK